MARLESVAVGGYYKLPTHLIPRVAPLLEKHISGDEVTFMDPCAGEGEAILGLIKLLTSGPKVKLYSCEMEATRATALMKATRAVNHQLLHQHVIHGDAFHVVFDKKRRDGVSVLLLNPPYEFDRAHGRMEHKFLIRFAPALAQDGALLFVVPHYALKASAKYLAAEFHNIHCFKFPDEDFAAFKQVVLFAQKGPSLPEPNDLLVARIEAYARDASTLPELPNITSEPLASIVSFESYHEGLEEWSLRAIDLAGLVRKVRPWHQSTRGGSYVPVHGILPDLPIHDLLLRKYPVATPPRPAHIAAGIAAGIFNGSRVEPTDPSLKLPPLLVKGVFDQEYRTVEEKYNEETGKTTLVQVQQPRLVATVLDLRTRKYHTLGSTSGPCPAQIDKLTVSGLLAYYGDSLMRVMEQQCPVLYDPRRDGDKVTLAQTARRPFTAQAHAAKALVMLLGGDGLPLRKRYGKGAFLLGEIGSGKSTVALVVSKTVGAKRPLIVCPPHLLTSWRDEIAAVLPEVEVRILEDVGSLERLAADESDQMIVSVVSRETAKLSHAWEGVGEVCPKCGGPTPPKVDLAKTRARCENRRPVGHGPIAAVVHKLCQQLMKYAPETSTISWLLRGRWERKRIEFYRKKREQQPITFPGFTAAYFDEALMALLPRFGEGEKVRQAIVWTLLCTGSDERIAAVANHFLKNPGYYEGEFGRQLLLMMTPHCPQQVELVAKHRNKQTYGWNPWADFEKLVDATQTDDASTRGQVAGLSLSWQDRTLAIRDMKARSVEAASLALFTLSNLAGFKWTPKCGEFLFQAIPEPRRVPLAQHILKHFPTLFDFLILDEVHEYGTEGSAQERAAHRLTELGIPTIEQTGSMMNGYAESMFMNVWSVSRAFREEFRRSDKQRFNDRYGYRKRIVTEKDGSPSKVVGHGAQSDRIETSERVVGNAPGVLPLFLLRHLLPVSVTLHKADLALDLPPCVQSKHLVTPTPEQFARYEVLQQTLVAQIRKDQFTKDLAGKLFGQLAELPSFLDRCTQDLGNTEAGEYEIRYPESVGGKLVAMQVPFPASEILPKEQWMLDEIEQELSEGRNVMVFSWHVALLPRLAKLISDRIGQKVPILYANKVPTAKRQDWITKQVVQKGARVMITNPVAIQTGLNNLVHFSTELWMENPACNPIIYRQAGGRVDRIGQDKETRIKFAVYAGTLQEALYDLLLQKVAVSISTDGLDPESALLAAGVGAEDFLTGLSIGKQLWAMLSEGLPKSSGPVYRPRPRAAIAASAPVSIFELMEGVE